MAERICKWCAWQKLIHDTDLQAVMQDYIDSIPEEERIGEEIYEKRIAACSSCRRCVNGLCGVCGCFVAVRAVRREMDCPAVDGSRW